MTLEKAQKIIQIWGTYLEYSIAKLNLVFMGGIPESFLPFSKDIIEEAVNILAKHYHDLGDKQAVDDLQRSLGWLAGHKDDEKALESLVKLFSDKKMRNIRLSSFKDFQNEWIKTQKL